jgi:hypothetical protein
LLALLLSADKKYVSAVHACDSGVLQVLGGAAEAIATFAETMAIPHEAAKACAPLLITKAQLQSHLGQFEAAIQTFK